MELLVVVAIIGVLATLLVPVFGKMKDAAQSAQCMQNLKTHYVAFAGYSADHDDYVVPYVESNSKSDPQPGQRHIWQQTLIYGGYLPASTTSSSSIPYKLRCPANPAGYLAGPRSPDSEDEHFKYGTPNYLYVSDAGTSCMDLGLADQPRPMKRSAIQPPLSKKALLLEGGPYFGSYRCNYLVSSGSPGYLDPDVSYYIIGDVHHDASHVLFWDGHIETFAKGTIDPEIVNWREDD